MKKHLMKSMMALALASMTVGFVNNALADSVDVKEFATGYFTPNEASATWAPYYRWYDEDWGWTHSAMAESIDTEAILWISAWDVDAASGELDLIYAYDEDSTTWIELGSLAGLDNAWGYTTFSLVNDLWDDVNEGLQVRIDIDSTNSRDYWAVSLAKSVLTIDGGQVPNPNPGAVPEPATALLFGCGIVGLAAAGRRRLN
jgi:hypothetical protein